MPASKFLITLSHSNKKYAGLIKWKIYKKIFYVKDKNG